MVVEVDLWVEKYSSAISNLSPRLTMMEYLLYHVHIFGFETYSKVGFLRPSVSQLPPTLA